MADYVGFVGGSYQSQSPNADAERAINWYVERIESGAGKSKAALYPTPGQKVFSIPTAAQQVEITSVQVSRAGTTAAPISTVEVTSYDTENNAFQAAVEGTGGSGATSYNPSPTSVSTFATSSSGSVSTSNTLGGWANVSVTASPVSLVASVHVQVDRVGAGAAGSGSIQYSVDGGTNWVGIANYSGSGTHAINTPLTGVTNLNLLKIKVFATAIYAGVDGGESDVTTTASSVSVSVSGAPAWALTFNAGVLIGALNNLASNESSNNLVCTNVDFGLPSGRTIKGIQVNITASVNVVTPSANKWKINVQLVYNGTTLGTPKSYSQAASAASPFIQLTFGGPTDLWGATLTDDIVSDPSFGMQVQVVSTTTSEVDFDLSAMNMTVTSSGDYYAVLQLPGGVPFSVDDAVIAYNLTAATWLNGVALTIDSINGNFVTCVNNAHPSAYPQTADTGTLYNLIASYAICTTTDPNPFSAGADITFASMTGENEWLNGTSAIIAADLTSDTFVIPVTHDDYGPVADTGIAFIGTVSTTVAARALYSVNGTRFFAIVKGNLFEVFSDGSFASRGNVTNDGLSASITANVNQLLISSAGLLYLYDLKTNVLTNVPNYNDGVTPMPAISLVDYCDGYFIALVADSQQFLISAILDGSSWDALDVAVVSVFPDNVISMVVDHREIWLQGSRHSVVYYDSGNPDFPFDVVPGSFIDEGAAASRATVRLDNSVFWVGEDDRGGRMAWRSQNYIPQRISTHAVEFAWSQYSTISDAVAYGYQDQGHAFYVIYFPTADATWVYDVATGLWHERAFWDSTKSEYTAHRSQNHAYCFGKHLVGDWKTGVIYDMNISYLDDFGNTIRRLRTAPVITNEMNWLYFASLQIDMQVGIGLASGQGSDPQVMMRYSDDETGTWSDYLTASAGKIGEYRKRVRWLRLGRSRNRIYEISVTDPVPWRIVAAYLEFN